MSTPSNLYAEKVFAEHPLALWALDDTSNYLSLISNSEKDFTNWTITLGEIAPAQTINRTLPLGTSFQSVHNSETVLSTDKVVMESPVIFTSSDLDQTKTTFAFSFYSYFFLQNIYNINVSYLVDDVEPEGISKDFVDPFPDKWNHMSSTFSLPEDTFTGTTKSFKIQITISYSAKDVLTPLSFCGITAGQWSEEFNASSFGLTKQALSVPIVNEQYALPAYAYGLLDSDAYYIVKDNSILAKNSGMPMVYGAAGCTRIIPNTDKNPSMLFPGHGFMNEIGKHQDLTAEFWIRIDGYSFAPRKIFGPVQSDDGLYVDGEFITLKIGEYVGSHFISEWYRPMLVHVVLTNNGAKLLINGDLVVTLIFDIDDISFPEKNYTTELGTKYNQDYLGFYAYSDVPHLDLDCFGIYPYQVPGDVAKRRFVFGQGVQLPEEITASYAGKTIAIDPASSLFASTYLYPDMGKWNQATIDNFAVDKNSLSAPNYKLPKIVFNNTSDKKVSDWYSDMGDFAKDVGAITFRPNSSWSDTDGYLLFEKLNLLSQNTSLIYGVFDIDISNINDQVLFKIEDSITGDYFLIKAVATGIVEGITTTTSIVYQMCYKGEDPITLYTEADLNYSEYVSAGIYIDSISAVFANEVRGFFGKRGRLKVYVGGSKDFSGTFTGYIHRVGFCTARNIQKIVDFFGADGFIKQDNDAYNIDTLDSIGATDDPAADNFDAGNSYTQFQEKSLLEHIASYTLYPKMYYDTFVIDIAVDSYWEDYVPLSYLAKNITTDISGGEANSLDFIQFNINYPKPVQIVENVFNNYNQYIKTYAYFVDLKTNFSGFDPNNYSMTTISNGADNVIVPDSSWAIQRYQIFDGDIIYVPSVLPDGVDITDIAIVICIEYLNPGILTKPIKIKNLQLSSRALNHAEKTSIGSKTGEELYPFDVIDAQDTYNSFNPFVVTKETKPYLYLTKTSGIRLLADAGAGRCLFIPVNSVQDTNFALSSIQATVNFLDQNFSGTPTKLFDILNDGDLLSVYIKGIEQDRAMIYATGQATPVYFFMNGKAVSNPYVTLNEWNTIGIAFSSPLNMANGPGAIKVFKQDMLVNNLSYYQESDVEKVIAGINRQWFNVLYRGENLATWDDWANNFDSNPDVSGTQANTWGTLLNLSHTQYFGVSPEKLYGSYTGTNKIIVGEDGKSVFFGNDEYNIYQNVVTTTPQIRY